MLEENQGPAAQGEAAGESGNAAGQSESAGGVSPGVQARFDELTKARREQERANVALQAKLEQQTQQLAALMAARTEPAPPKIEVDPERAAEIQAIVGPDIQRLRAQTAYYEQVTLGMQVADAARAAGVTDPNLVAQAQAVATALKNSGTPFVPLDAVKFVFGGVALDEAAKRREQAIQRGEFNNAGTSLMHGHSAPAINLRGETPYPANFESLSSGQQADWIEKNRLGDKAF